MSKEAVELREKRAVALAEARAMVDNAEKEKRNLNVDEKEKYDRLWADAESLQERASRLDQIAKADADQAEFIDLIDEAGEGTTKTPEERSSEEKELRERAFNKYLQYGMSKLSSEEERALVQGTDPEGGYTVPPEDFKTQLIKDVDNMLFFTGKATSYRLNKAKKMTFPTLAADVSDPVWTTEILTGDEDGDLSFGQIELSPNPLAKRIKVSKTLVRNSALGVQDIIRQRMAYKFAVAKENNVLNGDGSSKPLGLFVANANGISTDRDVRFQTGSTTAPDADTIKQATYNLKSQYWGSAEWILNKGFLQKVAILKTTDNQYLFKEGIKDGDPDTLAGHAINISEYAPNVHAADSYIAILGDLKHYFIMDDLDYQIQVLTELYAETNQIGYIARAEFDGRPALEEAFVRLQYANS